MPTVSPPGAAARRGGNSVNPGPHQRIICQSAAMTTRTRVTWGIAGLLIGAASVGAAWLLTGGSPAGIGTSSLSAPATVGGFRQFTDIQINQREGARATVDRVTTWNERSAERLSESHRGAAALVLSYGDDRWETSFTLLAVRAETPSPPFVPYMDPKELKLALPPEEAREIGEVFCMVRNQTTPEGREPEPGSSQVLSCSRTDAELTVEVRQPTGDLAGDPDRVAAIVDEAWAAFR